MQFGIVRVQCLVGISAKYHKIANSSGPVHARRAHQDYHSTPSWGSPPKPFDDARPVLITVQGQHRFAVFNATCARRMGLPNHRDGAAGDIDLFPEYGEVICYLDCNPNCGTCSSNKTG